MSKGIFIEGITVEMLRNASLEAVETLLNEGYIEDVEIPQWIPCSERLPETHETDGRWKESEKVLTIDDIGVFSVLSYEDDGSSCRYWVDEYGTAAAGVLAWRPLPEPWKGETE